MITNAQQHRGANQIFKLDFEDHFGHIYIIDVISSLKYTLHWLDLDDIKVLAEICCYNKCLPQGSPASPILSNMACELLDGEFDKLARSIGCKVTRLSDDTTFSTDAPRLPSELVTYRRVGNRFDIKLGSSLKSLIDDLGFPVNVGKLRVETRPDILTVTGLSVGDQIDVPLKQRRRLRAALHHWEAVGLDPDYLRSSGYSSREHFINSIMGHINFLGQVRGKNDALYQKYIRLFEVLRERDRRKRKKVFKLKRPFRSITLSRSAHARLNNR